MAEPCRIYGVARKTGYQWLGMQRMQRRDWLAGPSLRERGIIPNQTKGGI